MTDPMDTLIEGAKNWGVVIDKKQGEQFEQYMELLLTWNQRFNLTAITDPAEVVVQHFLDSLSLYRVKNPAENVRVLDMGTGAGFPGIPLKIVSPGLRLLLVDSVHKKTLFLREVVEQLALKDVEILHTRAEELGRLNGRREACGLVVSRAVAEMRTLVEYCLPFVEKGGYFAAYKGPGANEEVNQAQNAVKILGGAQPEVITIPIPHSPKIHNLVLIKKLTKTPNIYPRSGGKPRKSPL